MRKTLTAAVLAAGLAAAVLPVASANAYCDPVLLRLTGRCTNLCEIVNPGGPCPD
jgi:hypothetical protein